MSVQLSNKADEFCSSSNEGEVLLWSMEALTAPLRRFEPGPAAGADAQWVRHAGWVYTAEGDQYIAAALGGAGGIVLWLASDGSAPVAVQTHCSGAAIAWCGATRGVARLFTTGGDKRVRVFTVPALQQTACFHAAGSFGSSDGIGGEGAFASTGDALAVGDSSGRLYVLSLQQSGMHDKIEIARQAGKNQRIKASSDALERG